MRDHYEVLRSAMDTGAVDMALEILVDIAEMNLHSGNKDRAAEILALALCYPLDEETLELADAMFDDLETELCPRVMVDAKQRALEITLQDEVDNILYADL